MKEVVVYIAMSLDGYIADKNGSVSWLLGDDSDENNLGSYQEFIKTIDTVVLGYNTYYQIVSELSPTKWPYADKQSYILTHNKLHDLENLIFTDSNVTKLISKLKLSAKKNIWICGGASVINQMIDLKLVDEYCISIIPTILGEGVRLFDKLENSVKLKLKCTRSYNGIVDLVYENR